MTAPEPRDDLADLLNATGCAHHAAFIATDGFDPEWEQWYADHLGAPLREDHGFTGTDGELAAWLRATAEAHRAAGVDLPWPQFYAAAFRNRG
jgi:hypothetical protein